MKSLVIIPTYNEIENIESIIISILKLPSAFDILVVDDNSPDKTGDCVKSLKKTNCDRIFLIERKGKLGLGTAYIEGFKFAIENKYSFVYEMDADFSHNPSDLIRLDNTLKGNNSDMVIGSRYISGVNVVNWPMNRVLLSFFASKYVKFITRMNVKDPTSGFVGYSIECFKKLNLEKINFIGYAFQIEMKYKLIMLGFKFKEIPIIFTDRTKGTSKMSKNIIFEAIFGVIKLRLLKLINKL